MAIWSWIPLAAGLIGSIFGKGKPTQYTMAEPGWMQEYRKALMQMLASKIGQPSAGMQPTQQAYNLLLSRFFGGR